MAKNEDNKRDAEKEVRELELERINSENSIMQKNQEIQNKKIEIGAFDLDGLKDQVKRLESEKKRTESEIERANSQIAKKRGQIEILYAEIAGLEAEIEKNDAIVLQKDQEISETSGTIEANGLVKKEQDLSGLEGDLKKLQSEDGKILKSLTKEKGTIQTLDVEIKNEENVLKGLKEQLNTKKKLLDGMN